MVIQAPPAFQILIITQNNQNEVEINVIKSRNLVLRDEMEKF